MDRTYRIEKEESGILLGNRRRKNEEKEINESTELLSFRFFFFHHISSCQKNLKIEKKAKDLWDFIYFIRLGNQWYIHTYIHKT